MKGLFSFGGKKPTQKRPAAGFDDVGVAPPPKKTAPPPETAPLAGDVDPLDAFMSGVTQQAAKAPPKPKIARFEDDDDDPETEYMIALQAKKEEKKREQTAKEASTFVGKATGVKEGGDGAGEQDSDFDSDDEVYAMARAAGAGDKPNIPNLRTAMEELNAEVDHSKIEYEAFERCFYDEDPEVFAMSEVEVLQYRRQLDVRVSGEDAPRPVKTFAQCGFSEAIMKDIAKHGYSAPTPIQAQALPAALLGRDIIGIAKTGSGKTAAFMLPMVVHCLDQRELTDKEGPIGIVLGPTRELTQQIYAEAKKLSKSSGLQVVGLYGGASKNDQRLDLLRGAEIAVASPGRFIDMLKSKNTNCRRVTMLVLDEADRMLDMGFEPQIRCIMNMVRPDRQTLMFSATFKRRIRELAETLLDREVHITIGSIGEASTDVRQEVRVLGDATHKWGWMMETLPAMVDEGEVLVFVSTKVAAEELAVNLIKFNFRAAALHGDKNQGERDKTFIDFKKGLVQVLVATDVAARGLDVPTIRNVICFDPPRDKDAHTHRIGRTGRAGQTGTAYSLITRNQVREAGLLARSLQEVGQPVPEQLLVMAEKDTAFAQRTPAGRGRGAGMMGRGAGGGRGRGRGIGGAGLGFAGGGGGGTAGLGLATATGGGQAHARNRLVSEFKTSFIKGETQIDQRADGGGVGRGWPPPPPAGRGFPPPPPGAGGVPGPPPGGRGAGMTQPAWKLKEGGAEGGGGGGGGGAGGGGVESTAAAAAGGGGEGQPRERKRKSRWDTMS